MAKIREIMSDAVKAVSPEMTLKELAEFFVVEKVTGAPVVAGDRVVGVVSATDLLEFDSEDRDVPAYRPAAEVDDVFGSEDEWQEDEGDAPASYFADLWADAGAEVQTRLATEAPEWNALADHVVGEVMTRALLSVSPDADVSEAARRMVIGGVHRMLVMEDERLVGLVSASDIVRAVASSGLGA